MHPQTGEAVTSTLESIQHAVADILLTPLGSRIERRQYGSLLFRLIDQPLTGALVLMVYAASVTALTQHEDRLQLRSVRLEHTGDGSAELWIDGRERSTGDPIRFAVLLQGART